MKLITNTTSDLKLIKNLSPEQIQLIKKESMIAGVFNFFLNLAFGLIIFKGVSIIPIEGAKGFFQDLIICTLLTGFFNGMGGFNSVEKGLIKGTVQQSLINDDEVGLLKIFPKGGAARGMLFGLLWGALHLGIAYVVLNVLSITTAPYLLFAVLKGILCAWIAGSAVYFMSLASLHLKY